MSTTSFKYLGIGDTFDFIGPDRRLHSFTYRCTKLSPRLYSWTEANGTEVMGRVGSINVTVYHVQPKEHP
jgi:hypothetical protein